MYIYKSVLCTYFYVFYVGTFTSILYAPHGTYDLVKREQNANNSVSSIQMLVYTCIDVIWNTIVKLWSILSYA